MKLKISEYIGLHFVLGWVAAQALQCDYTSCVKIACFNAFIGAYLNNAHWIIWEKITGKKHKILIDKEEKERNQHATCKRKSC